VETAARWSGSNAWRMPSNRPTAQLINRDVTAPA
jgi:hypothetical protein